MKIKLCLTLLFALTLIAKAGDSAIVAGPDSRQINGKLVDFKAANQWLNEYAQFFLHKTPSAEDDHKLSSLWQKGKEFAPVESLNDYIYQVTDDGLIIGHDDKLVYVAHVPTAGLFDGEWVFLLAVRAGTYRNAAVIEQRTLKAYDFGTVSK